MVPENVILAAFLITAAFVAYLLSKLSAHPPLPRSHPVLALEPSPTLMRFMFARYSLLSLRLNPSWPQGMLFEILTLSLYAAIAAVSQTLVMQGSLLGVCVVGLRLCLFLGGGQTGRAKSICSALAVLLLIFSSITLLKSRVNTAQLYCKNLALCEALDQLLIRPACFCMLWPAHSLYSSFKESPLTSIVQAQSQRKVELQGYPTDVLDGAADQERVRQELQESKDNLDGGLGSKLPLDELDLNVHLEQISPQKGSGKYVRSGFRQNISPQNGSAKVGRSSSWKERNSALHKRVRLEDVEEEDRPILQLECLQLPQPPKMVQVDFAQPEHSIEEYHLDWSEGKSSREHPGPAQAGAKQAQPQEPFEQEDWLDETVLCKDLDSQNQFQQSARTVELVQLGPRQGDVIHVIDLDRTRQAEATDQESLESDVPSHGGLTEQARLESRETQARVLRARVHQDVKRITEIQQPDETSLQHFQGLGAKKRNRSKRPKRVLHFAKGEPYLDCQAKCLKAEENQRKKKRRPRRKENRPPEEECMVVQAKKDSMEVWDL